MGSNGNLAGIGEKLAATYREEGLTGCVHRIAGAFYRRVGWHLLPSTGYVRFNGVPVRRRKAFESAISWEVQPDRDRPDYEGVLLQAIRENLDEGMDVVVVGGGWGVSSVVAANAVGPSGSVTTYEASPVMAERIERTVTLSGFGARASVRRFAVGEASRVWYPDHQVETVPASELPECDALVLDCEGAEIEILGTMTVAPEAIAVETHGCYDAPSSEVGEILRDLGYHIQESRWTREPAARERDLRLLIATREAKM
jgi:hypothetical protein